MTVALAPQDTLAVPPNGYGVAATKAPAVDNISTLGAGLEGPVNEIGLNLA